LSNRNDKNFQMRRGIHMESKSAKISNSNFTGNLIQGDVSGDVKTHSTPSEQQQNLIETVAEIQQLLQQMEKSYPTNTTYEKLTFTAEAIRQIDSNPKVHQRVLSALKAGGVQALGQALNHPAASFLIGALEDWQNSK
jgi:energy-coupling factor transporter ATP-binding protein EcfA2